MRDACVPLGVPVLQPVFGAHVGAGSDAVLGAGSMCKVQVQFPFCCNYFVSFMIQILPLLPLQQAVHNWML